jgi:hypothetical protein
MSFFVVAASSEFGPVPVAAKSGLVSSSALRVCVLGHLPFSHADRMIECR